MTPTPPDSAIRTPEEIANQILNELANRQSEFYKDCSWLTKQIAAAIRAERATQPVSSKSFEEALAKDTPAEIAKEIVSDLCDKISHAIYEERLNKNKLDIPNDFQKWFESRLRDYSENGMNITNRPSTLLAWQAATEAERARIREALPSEDEIYKESRASVKRVIFLNIPTQEIMEMCFEEGSKWLRDRIGIGEGEGTK